MHAYTWYVWRKQPSNGPSQKVRIGRSETIAVQQKRERLEQSAANLWRPKLSSLVGVTDNGFVDQRRNLKPAERTRELPQKAEIMAAVSEGSGDHGEQGACQMPAC
jgi:hypothetical protein